MMFFLWQPRKQIRVEIKNLQKEFNGRFKQAEEKKISKLKDKRSEMIHFERKKEE